MIFTHTDFVLKLLLEYVLNNCTKLYNEELSPQSVWVVAAAIAGQSHVAFIHECLQLLAVSKTIQIVFFLDLGTKRIQCRHRLTGEVLILLGTGLPIPHIELHCPKHINEAHWLSL